MVIKQVRHWIKLRANAGAWKAISDWAESRGASFTQMEEGEGFLIEQRDHAFGPMRIEWGPPQRAYIDGPELRLRWELGLHPDLQLMVMERELRDALERMMFEAYTDTLQTRVDTDTPEEVRWLVMFAPLEQWKAKLARARFSVCAVTKELAEAWVEGALSDALSLATQDLVPAKRAFVMLTQRGNLYLRLGIEDADIETVRGLARLGEVAAKASRELQQRLGEAGIWQTTNSVAFGPSTMGPEGGDGA